MDRPHKANRRTPDAAAALPQKRPRPQKKAVNLSVNRELLDRARAAGINLSHILESVLDQKLRDEARERWLAENRTGIEAYNEDVEKHGVFSDGLRAF